MPRNSIIWLRWTVLNAAPVMNNNNNNNNNNRVHVMQIRDRMFRMMFVRVAVAYAAFFPEKARRAIENIILFFSILSFLCLTYTHTMFIHTPMDCLDSVHEEWPRDGILRVEVVHGNSTGKPYTLEDSYRKEVLIRRFQAMEATHHSFFDLADPKFHRERKISKTSDISIFPVQKNVEMDEASADSTSNWNQPKVDGSANQSSDSHETSSSDVPGAELRVAVRSSNSTDETQSSGISNATTATKYEEDEVFIDSIFNTYIVEYSLEYGYLKMSAKARRQLKVPIKMIVLDSSTDKCFGNWLTRFFLDYVVGYDEVLLSSVSRLASKVGSKGFIRNVVKDHYFRFVNVMGHASYAFAAFIMFVFTFSISTLLRYAHHQIFLFIVQLLRMFELRSSVTIQAAPLLTVILSLVGMEAIMSEFFSDPTTSFYVIMIVWVADQYDAICCRTTVSRRHWLRFFYLFHFAFYAYEYRFSGQYSNLALFTSCCFIFHSMVYFFHHYELPVIMRFVSRIGHRGQRVRAPPRDPEPPDVEPSVDAPAEESASSSSSTSSSGTINLNDARLDASSDSTSEESSRNQGDDDYDEYTPGSSDSAEFGGSPSPIPRVIDGAAASVRNRQSASRSPRPDCGGDSPSSGKARSDTQTSQAHRHHRQTNEQWTLLSNNCRVYRIVRLVRVEPVRSTPSDASRSSPSTEHSSANSATNCRRDEGPICVTSDSPGVLITK